jgi:tetratricopeptide (TPR) repeat protein
MVPSGKSAVLKNAYAEYIESMTSRPDDAVSHYNIGNFSMAQNQPRAALESYEIALDLRPDFTPAFVNAALIESRLGHTEEALKKLETARKVGQQSDAVELNLGMLYAELEKMDQAEAAFRHALKLNPRLAQAAFNLGILLAQSQSEEALQFTAKAWELEPQNSRYGYTHAFFLFQFEQTESAITVLKQMVEKKTDEASVYFLLGKIYEEQGQTQKAQDLYRVAAENENLHPQIRQRFFIQSRP